MARAASAVATCWKIGTGPLPPISVDRVLERRIVARDRVRRCGSRRRRRGALPRPLPRAAASTCSSASEDLSAGGRTLGDRALSVMTDETRQEWDRNCPATPLRGAGHPLKQTIALFGGHMQLEILPHRQEGHGLPRHFEALRATIVRHNGRSSCLSLPRRAAIASGPPHAPAWPLAATLSLAACEAAAGRPTPGARPPPAPPPAPAPLSDLAWGTFPSRRFELQLPLPDGPRLAHRRSQRTLALRHPPRLRVGARRPLLDRGRPRHPRALRGAGPPLAHLPGSRPR